MCDALDLAISVDIFLLDPFLVEIDKTILAF